MSPNLASPVHDSRARSRRIDEIIALQQASVRSSAETPFGDEQGRVIHESLAEIRDERSQVASAPLDLSSHLVCRHPSIWVLDDLLSEKFLRHIDDRFFEQLENVTAVDNLDGRSVRALELDIDEDSQELMQVLCAISHVEEVEPCRKAWILEVAGANQKPHMDRVDLRVFGNPSRENLNFLDLAQQSCQSSTVVIPTLSFVIYFNDVGGCTFPYADLTDQTIPGKRGRIIMFQNYMDSQRPTHNLASMHYGTYDNVPKRVMTAGMLSNVTPPTLSSWQEAHGQLTKGVLYCPNGHDNPAYGKPHGQEYDDYMREQHHPSPPRIELAPAVGDLSGSKRREWWWLQGEHRLPVHVIQWKMYAQELQPLLSAGHDILINAGQASGFVMDLSPAPHEIWRAETVAVTNTTVANCLGSNLIAGWSAAFWNLPPSQLPPSPLLKEGRGRIIDGYYQVHREDVEMAQALGSFLADSTSPSWPYPDRPFPKFPRRRVVLLIEEVTDIIASPVMPPEAPEGPAARQKAASVFNLWSSGNGKMTRDEMGLLLRSTDPHWPDDAITSTFSMVDSFSDGFVDVEEFTRWVLTPDTAGAFILAVTADGT